MTIYFFQLGNHDCLNSVTAIELTTHDRLSDREFESRPFRVMIRRDKNAG